MKKYEKVKTNKHIFERLSNYVTHVTGSSKAFVIAALLIVVWLISGPFFDFSENWQLVINTGTTIITFLMVFLIQKSQNKESLAIQLKLNELIAAHEFASNRLVNVEGMTDEELQIIQQYYYTLSELSKHAKSLQESHSVEEIAQRHPHKEKSIKK